MTGLISYGAGNLTSVAYALERIDEEHCVIQTVDMLHNVDRVIFPGVGEARHAMKYLKDTGLASAIRSLDKPFLGICLGMQVLFEESEERDTECLGILEGVVKKFSGKRGKVPHMGWNTVRQAAPSPLFTEIEDGEHFYFVHSYYAPETSDSIATTEYGQRFSSAVHRDNFYGTQFHPEKSGDSGEKLLRNFIAL